MTIEFTKGKKKQKKENKEKEKMKSYPPTKLCRLLFKCTGKKKQKGKKILIEKTNAR